jgi:hypothetical protein
MGTLHHHHPHVPALPMAFNENSEKSSNPNVINAASTGTVLPFPSQDFNKNILMCDLDKFREFLQLFFIGRFLVGWLVGQDPLACGPLLSAMGPVCGHASG